MTDILRVERLRVEYGKAVAVRDVSFSIRPGTMTVIVGPNGAGKSSLLNGVMGVTPAAVSGLFVAGKPIHNASAPDRVVAGLVLVPQGRQLFRHMSVLDNLLVTANAFGLPRSRVDQALARFPILHERRRSLAGVLSGGEQQMLALSRALMCDPTVLALDEPTLGLAPAIVKQLIDGLRALLGEGKSIIIAEPTIRLLPREIDQGLILLRGEIAGVADTIDELETRYQSLLAGNEKLNV